jgi:hypothetical protein
MAIANVISGAPLRLLFLALLVTSAASAAELSWERSTDVATGGGERGPWQQNESRYDYVDDGTVAMNDLGQISVAWVEQKAKDVFFQRFSADGVRQLNRPVNVSRSPGTFSWLPRIAIAPYEPQKILLLWQEIIFSGGSHGGDILFARSDDRGTTFSQPLNLSRSPGGDGKGRISKDLWHNGSLDIAAGNDGAVYAAWTEYEGALWLARSRDGGRTFSAPARLSGDEAHPARAPSLAVALDGTLYLAWTTGEDRAADIRVAKSSDGGGTFGAPQIVARTKGFSDAPKLAVDARGMLHLVYAEDGRVWYTRSEDGAQHFAPPRAISAAGAGFPSLGLDSHDNPHVLWELYPEARKPPRGLGIAWSRDRGKTFLPPAVVAGSADPSGGSNGSHQGLLMQKLAVNRHGALAIVNSSLKEGERDGGRSRVWLIRGRVRE